MAVAVQLTKYLTTHGVSYDVVEHRPAITAQEAAQQANIPSDWMLKAVLLRDNNGYVLAIVPASERLNLGRIRIFLRRRMRLATEKELAKLFSDCEPGAIPAVGAAYNLDMLVDDTVANRPEIYFEGGDHRSLIHMNGTEFLQLAVGARRERLGSSA